MRIIPILRAAWAAPAAALLGLLLPGCGGSGDAEPPKPIEIVNPDPKDPRKGITLENEYQNADRIRSGAAVPRK
jgi:hypothetical protein